MPTVFQDLGLWFWRLVPANPILVRVVFAGGRRVRHLWIRIFYLAILTLLVVFGVVVAQNGGNSLAELAKEATRVFKNVSIIQLGMVCILAPVFAAAAITQEKDSQTYNILLSTPLSNGQIVLGSLLSRLYFVFVLLLAGIPLFCILMVYGGVTGDKIAMSISLAAATAMFTGALAISISVIKIGTGRTVFSFYLAIAIYLIVLFALASWTAIIPPEAQPPPGQTQRMSWLAPFHPFLALWVVLGETPAPDYGAVAHYGFPGKYLLAYPHQSYIVVTVIASLLLILMSLSFVRRGAKEGEVTLWSKILGVLPGRRATVEGEGQGRKPRHVAKNPIRWRESVTGAAAGGGRLTRWLILIFGMTVAIALLIAYGRGDLKPAEARQWLYGVVAVELGIALFLATTTAATSMTREKESNTLELLLATPLTSAHIITGKTWGLVVAAWPMLAVPYMTVLLFLFFDLFTGRLFGKSGDPVLHAEIALTLPIILISFTAFACMIGLQASIRNKKTMGAVFSSMGLVLLLFAATGGCAMILRQSDNPYMTAAFMPICPVTAVFITLSPHDAVNAVAASLSATDLTTCRVIAAIATLCTAAIYFLFGWQMRHSMVRNFDMTIRKQTA